MFLLIFIILLLFYPAISRITLLEIKIIYILLLHLSIPKVLVHIQLNFNVNNSKKRKVSEI